MARPENSKQTLTKNKVVIIYGKECFIEDFKLTKGLITIGNGKETIDNLIRKGRLNILKGRTDKDTLFIIFAHGILRNSHGIINHYIENVLTAKLLKKLQKIVGHKITVDLCSCHAGASLKRSEIGGEISLITEAGSKYPSLSDQNHDSFKNSIKLKISDGLTNEQIFSNIIGSRPETIYYLPMSDSYSENKEEQSKVLTKEEYKELRDKRKIIKFERPGKFTLEEVRKILTDSEHFKIFESSNKTHFSIDKIKKLLEITATDNEEKKTAELSEKDKFLLKFRTELGEKLSPSGIKEHLDKRRNAFNEIVQIEKEHKKLQGGDEIISNNTISKQLLDFWFIALNRGLIEEINIILKDHPDIINQVNEDKQSALMHAAEFGNIEIVKILIAAGADLNIIDKESFTALMSASTYGKIGVVKELLKEEGINLNHAAKDGYTALMLAAEIENVEIVKELVKKEGIYLNQSNSEGETAQKIASNGNNDELAYFLEEALEEERDLQNQIKEEIDEINQGNDLDENFSLSEMEPMIALGKRYSQNKHLFDNIYDVPILSQLLIHSEDKEAIKLLGANLETFISFGSLTKIDQEKRTTLIIAIERANEWLEEEDDNPFIKIAASLAVKMKCDNVEKYYEEYQKSKNESEHESDKKEKKGENEEPGLKDIFKAIDKELENRKLAETKQKEPSIEMQKQEPEKKNKDLTNNKRKTFSSDADDILVKKKIKKSPSPDVKGPSGKKKTIKSLSPSS